MTTAIFTVIEADKPKSLVRFPVSLSESFDLKQVKVTCPEGKRAQEQGNASGISICPSSSASTTYAEEKEDIQGTFDPSNRS